MEDTNQTAQLEEVSTTEEDTNSIEKPKKTKRPRTPAQKEAWAKCLEIRKKNFEGREKAKLAKYVENKLEEKRRPVEEEPVKKPKPKKKKIVVVESESESESSDSSIEVVVKRKPKTKPKKDTGKGYDTPPDTKQFKQKPIETLISWL